MNIEEYKKDIFDFDRFNSLAKQDYVERLGDPDELPSSIGLITIGFNMLDEVVSNGIAKMIGVDGEVGDVITCEMSFKAKVHLFSSLVHKLKAKCRFNALPGYEEEYYKELIKALFKCEELRNKAIHSSFEIKRTDGNIYRIKKTSKANKGLVVFKEAIDISWLLNIYDYTISMAMEVDNFFIDFSV